VFVRASQKFRRVSHTRRSPSSPDPHGGLLDCAVAIHPTAVVAAGAELAEGVSLGPYVVVESDTSIGPDCEIRAHAVVKRHTQLGRENVIHEGAVLGGEPQDLSFTGDATRLEIGDRNVIREGVTLHRATKTGSPTRLGSDCYLMAYAHVAHDCQLSDRVILANNVALGGHVSLGERAFLGGGAMVHQFCQIGRLAMVGGMAKVTQDCLPFLITDGVRPIATGPNTVGLRRAGWNAAQLRGLKAAYRILLREAHSLEEALEQLAALADPNIDEWIAFVRTSTRGFHRADV